MIAEKDYAAFKEGIEGVYSFYNKELSSFALDVWWNSLRAFDLTAVIDSFNRHLMNPDSGQWLPKPADIIKMFGGRTLDRALLAWSKVDRAVRSVGTYESVVFDDPLIHRVIHEMGGWIGLGNKDEKEWPFIAKEFENRYRGYAMRGETPEYQPVLTGIAEAYNGSESHEIDPPRLIGDREKALLVMAGGKKFTLIGSSNPVEQSPKLALVRQ